MIKGVGHIGLLVKDIEQGLESLAKIVDFPTPVIRESAEAQMKVAVVDLGQAIGANRCMKCVVLRSDSP